MAPSWTQYRKEGKLSEDAQLKKLGLLVVDDEAEIVGSLGEMFAEHFELHRCTSGREALEVFKEHSPKIILSDQRMPEMSGLELFKELKEIDPSTVRILVTGYSDINVVIEALNEGLIWKYVTKPWDHEEFRQLVLQSARHYLKENGLPEDQFALKGFMGF
ncbi:MAG: response regulator [Deltaproteobacteria bacterium]|nr:response regulator [Deltaproteobacteria bacterium]